MRPALCADSEKTVVRRSQLRMQGEAARWHNAAYTYSPGKHVQIAGKRVVLVDDILTSGRHRSGLRRPLRQMGAAEVYFLMPGKETVTCKKNDGKGRKSAWKNRE